MKWFKHKTDSWNDEKLASVTAEHGLELYGFWWRVLEIIGSQMNGTGKSSCQYSAKTWGKFAGISAKKFQKFADILSEKKLIILENRDTEVFINIPNMVNYRDEWSRKQQKEHDETPE